MKKNARKNVCSHYKNFKIKRQQQKEYSEKKFPKLKINPQNPYIPHLSKKSSNLQSIG